MICTLENDYLRLRISQDGAELVSIYNKEKNYEMLWNAGDAWKRHSPVLFPIVGGLKDKSYCTNGKYYSMGQHGFARDKRFELYDRTPDSVTMKLREDAETLSIFPFSFRLYIVYILEGKKIQVIWKVYNPNDCELHFSIGGHPAFMCPTGEGKQSECFLHFDEEGPLSYNWLSEDGLCKPEVLSLPTDGGFVSLPDDFFDHDAYVMYNDRMRTVSLSDKDKNDYLRVHSDTPVYGIWSAKGKHAPFVCIEPWYGRCDAVDFSGDWQDREHDNCIDAGEEWEGGYVIEVV